MKTLRKLLGARMRVLLVGPPGLAKTARITACARAANVRIFHGIDGRTCDLMDRVDASGALVPDVARGVTEVLPLRALLEIEDCRELAIWFLDEIGRAPIDVQGALCSVMDRLRAKGSPVLVWAATNRPQDRAGVSALSEQLRSRFDCAFSIATPGAEEKADGATLLGSWADEVAGWCEYVLDTYSASPESAEIAATVVAWHRSPQLGVSSPVGPVLYGWKPCADSAVRMPDFRTWDTALRLMIAGAGDLATLGSAIGKPQAAAYLSFAALADKIPAPEQVWMDPLVAPVPTDAGALCLVAVRLASACTAQHCGALAQYMRRMPQVFGALAGRDAYRRLGSKLAGNRNWQSWFMENQELFATGN